MALLADVFGRGLAAAKPGSPAEGYQYFSTDTGLLERYSGSAWEVISYPGLIYKFSTTTTDSDPGAGVIRFNNATPASVTIIFVDDNSLLSDADLGTAWDAVTGARVLITQVDDPAKFLLGEVTADADGTGYWKLTVTVDDSGTLPDNNAVVSVIVLGGGGGGGGTSPRLFFGTRQMYAGASFMFGAVYQIGGQTVSVTTDASSTDTEKLCSQWAPTGTTQSYIRVNDTSVKPTMYPDMRFDCKLEDNDDGIMWAGWIDQTTPPATGVATPGATSGIACAMVRAKNGTDTNYQFVTSTLVADEVTDTGVAIDGSWHDFRIFTDDGGVTWHLEIDGVLVASNSTTVPATSTGICPIVSNIADTSSTRQMRVSYYHVYQGKSALSVI